MLKLGFREVRVEVVFPDRIYVNLQEKESQLGEDLGRDQQGVYALQRYHRAFEADLQPLGNQVWNGLFIYILVEVIVLGIKRVKIEVV